MKNKITRKTLKEYYKAGREAYECGHPEDPNEMRDDSGNELPQELIDAYWDGYYNAQEEFNQKYYGG